MTSIGCWVLLLAGCATQKPMMMVNVPVADLRAAPQTAAQPAAHDPLEETQLLYGERVRVLERKDGWFRVEAVEQPEFTHSRRWQGYPGWMPAVSFVSLEQAWPPTIVVTEKWAATRQDVYRSNPSRWRFPMGTRLRATDMDGAWWRVELLDGTTVWMPHHSATSLMALNALSPEEKRRVIVRNAAVFLGDPYYWGGRSPRTPESAGQVTGVDCSGLVNLAYRAAGIDIPRDAHEQFLRARPVKTLHPADLIFLSDRGNPTHIVHVMLYAGGDEVIEGPGTGRVVRRIALTERLGQPVARLVPGMVLDTQTVFFGTYVPE